MADDSKDGPFFKAWRKLRGMTQSAVLDRLAEMDGDMPRTGASLSRLENGKQPYSQEILEALAVIYDTTPGKLLDHNPQVGAVITSIDAAEEFRELPQPAKEAIMAVINLAKTDR